MGIILILDPPSIPGSSSSSSSNPAKIYYLRGACSEDLDATAWRAGFRFRDVKVLGLLALPVPPVVGVFDALVSAGVPPDVELSFLLCPPAAIALFGELALLTPPIPSFEVDEPITHLCTYCVRKENEG